MLRCCPLVACDPIARRRDFGFETSLFRGFAHPSAAQNCGKARKFVWCRTGGAADVYVLRLTLENTRFVSCFVFAVCVILLLLLASDV